jgi:hypothetical protein
MADAEGVIAELKNLHGLDRVRCRGMPVFRVQLLLLLGCAAINPKRLGKHVPAAQEGVAAAPKAADAALTIANDHCQGDHQRASIRLSRRQLAWTLNPCLN